jgi:hypothetical protein
MQRCIAQEFHVYDENMLASNLFYLSEHARQIWKSKKEAIESGSVYIGG